MIGADDLKGVTPDAKTRFVIVDAVGLTEHDKTETQPLNRKHSVPVERLLQLVAEGSTDPDVVSTLAVRLDPDTQERRTAEMAKGMTVCR